MLREAVDLVSPGGNPLLARLIGVQHAQQEFLVLLGRRLTTCGLEGSSSPKSAPKSFVVGVRRVVLPAGVVKMRP
jgi:hypothetical protein